MEDSRAHANSTGLGAQFEPPVNQVFDSLRPDVAELCATRYRFSLPVELHLARLTKWRRVEWLGTEGGAPVFAAQFGITAKRLDQSELLINCLLASSPCSGTPDP